MCDNGDCVNMDGRFKCVCHDGFRLLVSWTAIEINSKGQYFDKNIVSLSSLGMSLLGIGALSSLLVAI